MDRRELRPVPKSAALAMTFATANNDLRLIPPPATLPAFAVLTSSGRMRLYSAV